MTVNADQTRRRPTLFEHLYETAANLLENGATITLLPHDGRVNNDDRAAAEVLRARLSRYSHVHVLLPTTAGQAKGMISTAIL